MDFTAVFRNEKSEDVRGGLNSPSQMLSSLCTDFVLNLIMKM